jgi:hypothetical protein
VVSELRLSERLPTVASKDQIGSIETTTPAPYSRARALFFAWCESRDLVLADIEPIHVGAYVRAIREKFEKPTVRQRSAAIKMLVEGLIVGQVVAINSPMPSAAPSTWSSFVQEATSNSSQIQNSTLPPRWV